MQQRDGFSCCAIIPAYNNAGTLAKVVDDVLAEIPSVVVVNDGSTDDTLHVLESLGSRISIVSYAENKGKGHALSIGFQFAREKGYTHVVTLDSDGQHFASDIPKFLQKMAENPNALVVGNRNLTQDNMPKKNTFANRFSNFWFTVQTAHRLPDTQTGFRLYPLHLMCNIRPLTSRYEAELELLVRCAWRGIRILSVPVEVYYAPEGERISHFRPCRDFLRISLMNTFFCVAAIFYGYPSMLIRKWIK